MSMLSAQCDELRERAATLRQGRWSDGADDARLMEDAAETILSLRDRAQDLQAENAKLRELVRYMWDFSCVLPDEPYTSKEELAYSVEVWKRMRELGIEVDA